MAGKKGRSGRKPQSARAAFFHFATEYTERGFNRYEAWLQAEHEAALNGDGTARRFLIEQYLGKPRQAHEMDVNENVTVTLKWADGRTASVSGGTSPEAIAAIDGESRVLPPLQQLPRVRGGGDDPTAE